MKRDIKFRAWDGEKMIFRGLHDRNWYTDEKSGKAVKGTHPSDTHHLTVMQFTGLYDKNGKEIYEGDKVKHPMAGEPEHLGWVVVWRKNSWQGKCICEDQGVIYTRLTKYFKRCEVIGNIHETPH